MSAVDSLVYHRIVSPTLSIPSDTSVPIPVGLLACQREPYLKEIETYVITCVVSSGIEPPKDKKKVQSATEQKGPIYEVLLHDTVLFPEGGGQPSDVGYIRGLDGVCWTVLEVKRRGGHAIHYVAGGPDTPCSLAAGARVTAALGGQGFNRRYDHMCIHTAQHLISALLETRLGLPTVSWYLTPSPQPAYVEVPRAPTPEELQGIEDAANDCCIEGTRVHVEVDELETHVPDDGARNAHKSLPADYTGGVSRTVVIEGVDRNPCCGTHLPSLQGLAVFVLPQTEPLSRGRARIFFCAGPRTRTYLSQTHGLLAAAATAYGCAPAQVPERLSFETEARRRAHKRAEELEDEVAGFVVKDLQDEQQEALATRGTLRRFSAFRHRYESAPNPLGLLTKVHAVWSASPAAATPYLVVLVSSSGVANSPGAAVVLVFGSDEKEVREVGDNLKAKGVKGGGKAGKWSGKVENWKATGGDEWMKDLIHV